LDISYRVKDKILFVDPKDAWQHKPDYFVHIDEVDPIKDACGEIRELLSTENMSHAYVTLHGVAKEHKHHIMEEVYTIIKGQGYITISGNKYDIEKGDTISIPKNEWHYLESHSGLELLVVTSPRFDPKDVILR
jgi:mannose-6-phosphate isomerase-like protein (cupin superfamily)